MPLLLDDNGMMINHPTYFLTMKCNLRCNYCKAWKLKRNELSIEEWKDCTEILKRTTNLCFISMMGGEITLLKDGLISIIEHLNSNNVQYAVITNGVIPDHEFRRKLLQKSHNISASFDTLTPAGKSDNTMEKHYHGQEILFQAKRYGVRDVLGLITLKKGKVREVRDIINMLYRNGIWVSVNSIHYAKDKSYDWIASKKDIELVQPSQKEYEEYSEMLMDVKKYNPFMHNPVRYFKELPKYARKLNWKCKYWVPAIDSDGTLRPCIYRTGKLKKFTYLDFEDKLDQIEKVFDEDRKACKGCYWDCCHILNTSPKNEIIAEYQHTEVEE